MKNISRRDFLKGAMAGTAGIAAANLLGGFTAFAEDAKEAPKTEAGVPEWDSRSGRSRRKGPPH